MQRPRMGSIAAANLREHRNSFAAVFVTVFSAALMVCALGVVFESGIRGGVTPHRLSGADVVVGAPQTLEITEDVDQPYSERARLPESTVDDLAALPGVESAVGDISAPLTDDSGRPFDAHGWSSAVLAPYSITAGHPPAGPNEVVLTGHADLGHKVTLRHGGVAHTYTVVGVAGTSSSEPDDRPATVFLDDVRMQQLWPHAGTVATIGLIGQDGVDAETLAARVRDHLPAVAVHTYTGPARADAEYVDIGAARGELVALSSALAGVALMIAVFVVSSTLSLSIQQRRRDFALLRATGATPRQIHKLIGAETWVIASVAATLGVAPGYLLADVLRGRFADAGILPPDFSLAYGPVPALVAVAAAVATARLAAAFAARRPARLDPIDALRESAVEPEKLNRTRAVLGLLAGLSGLVVATLPAFIPGPAAMAGAGGSAVLLVMALALLGPALVTGVMRVVSGPMVRTGSAGPVLAAANLDAHGRRLAAAITPLALAIAIGAVQLFSQSTVTAAAERQSESGTKADLVVTSPGGISPQLAETIATMDAVGAVNPITRTKALFTTDSSEAPTTEAYPVQGIDVAGASATIDLDVREGDLRQLSDGTVALSRDASSAMSADVGDTVKLRMGDGAVITPRVVATYDRGLGFGDVTLPASQVRDHTTTGLVDQVLVSTRPGGTDEAQRAIEAAGDVTVMRSNEFTAAARDDQRAQDSVNVVALAVLLGFLGIAVVNTLVLMTSARRREFALLQLLGADPRQVRGMIRLESLIAVAVAAIAGTVIAYPPLAGIAIAVSGGPFPVFSPSAFGVIVGATTVLGFGAITLTARRAIRLKHQVRGL